MTTCTLCLGPLDPEREPIRHDRCASRLDRGLAALPALYALMGAVLAPGAVAGGSRVSGATRTAPLPVRIEPLSLRASGGVATTMAAWEAHIRDARGFTQTDRGLSRRDLAATTMWLRAHLSWTIEHYPHVRDYDSSVRTLAHECRSAAGILPAMMRIGECPNLLADDVCGTALYVDPHGDEIRCPRCHSLWKRPFWMMLGRAMREEVEAA